ncbi:MAG TPA: Lrp/AsnC ligand binding domain-containing protein [Armatimonadota bacterium]|nr:Lrp/AsnC ligand binding domain-containing protein [Armatimonadota bacterium]
MVTAIVLITAERMSIPETAETLAEIEGVAEVYSVSGEFDIVAILRVRQYEELASLVTERLLKIPTITRTQTHMAFQAYSKHDLERIFGIGAEV